jgi:BMFP domain-containing protein YqiC
MGTQQAQVYQKLANTLKNKRETIRKNIKKAEKDSLESLHHQIEAVFEDAFNAISYFAEDHWNSNEEGMKRGWNKKLKDIKFEERIDTVYKDVGKTFNKEVTEILEEVGKELQLIAQLGDGIFNFTEQDSDIFMRHAMKIGGSILGLVGSLLFFTPLAPIGWVFIGVGFLVGLFSGFFKSQDQKRREAVTKISDSLSSQLSSQKKDTLQKVEENFKKSCDEVLTNIDTYFEELIQGLEQTELNVQKHYEKAETKLQYAIDGAVEDIRQEVEEVLSGNLVKAFVACLDKSQNVTAKNPESGMDVERIQGQVNFLKNYWRRNSSVKFTNLATRSFVKTAAEQGFLRSMDVAGSSLHQGVVAVGKFVGFKFKPWQAVGIAKNIGNAARFLGPALALVSVGIDVLQIQQEQQRERQMADVRRDITSPVSGNSQRFRSSD